MKLKTLTVAQWKRFAAPFSLSFQAGLNLVVGPNESGKSSLAQAIRAAFLERYTTGTVDEMRPWGDSSAAPEVGVEFEFEGQLWRLQKRFLQRKRCDLSIGAVQLEGEEAENRLADLLGYHYPGRGASKPEHWGVPGLLWVEQGTGQQLLGPVTHAANTLQASLTHEVGAISSTAGDAVLARIGAWRDELLTAAGKPRNALKASLDERDALQAQCRALAEQVEQYRQQVDRLAELRAQSERDVQERPELELESQLGKAREGLERAQRVANEVEQLTERLATLEREAALLRQRQQQIQQQEQVLKASQTELQTLLAEQQNQQAPQDALRLDLEQAQRNLGHWQALKAQLDQAQQRKEWLSQQQALQLQHQRLSQQLTDALAVRQALTDEQRELAQIELKANALKPLKLLDAEIRELQIRQRSAATRLEHRLLDGVTVTLDEAPLQGSGDVRLTQTGRLVIAGVGELQITPGGDDLGDLNRRLSDAQQAFVQQLNSLGIESLDQGLQRVARTELLMGQLAQRQHMLRSLAPEGLDALQSDVAQRAAQLQHLAAQLSQLPEADADLPPRDQALGHLQQAEARVQALESQQRELDSLATRHEVRISEAQRRVAEAQAQFTALLEHQSLAQIASRLAALAEQQAQGKRLLEELRLRLEQAKPEILNLDVKRLEQSLRLLRDQRTERREAIIRLEEALRSLGAEGLEEQLQALRAKLQQAQERHQQLDLRAQALVLLQQRLGEKRDALTRRLQAPLVARMNHYLRLLFDQAEARVNDALMLEQVARRDGQVAFDEMSFGAREQTALICRLAYADLLKQAGRPTLVVLDDALVHSDRSRLQNMKRVLFDAAQRHQILIFSCHPQDWQDLGVKAVELG